MYLCKSILSMSLHHSFSFFFIVLAANLTSPSVVANYESNLNVKEFKSKWLNHLDAEDIGFSGCPDLIKPEEIFNADSMYCEDDSSHSTICEDNQEQYEQEKKNIDAYLSILADLTSTYMKDPNPSTSITTCFVKHINHWAKYNALGAYPQPTNQGEYMRFSTLAKVSEFYLAFHKEISQCPWCQTKENTIFAWFKRLADYTILHFHNKELCNADSSKSNHRYWGGLAALNVGLITGDYKYFDWARVSYLIGIDQIAENGSLPLELKRGKLALAYHFYAAAPLIAMQDKFRANGISTSQERLSLNKLVNFSHGSYHQYLSTPLATEQYIENVNYCSYAMAGLEIYLKRNSRLSKNPNADLHAILLESGRNSCNQSGLIFSTGLGSEVTLLHGIINLENVIHQ